MSTSLAPDFFSCPRALHLSPHPSVEPKSTLGHCAGSILVKHSIAHIWAQLSLAGQGKDHLIHLSDLSEGHR